VIISLLQDLTATAVHEETKSHEGHGTTQDPADSRAVWLKLGTLLTPRRLYSEAISFYNTGIKYDPGTGNSPMRQALARVSLLVFGGKLASYVICDVCKSVSVHWIHQLTARFQRVMKTFRTFHCLFMMQEWHPM